MLKRRVEGNLRKYVLKSGKMCFEFNGNRTKCHMALFKKYEKLNNRTSLVAQTVKRLSTMQETWVQSLGWEDPLEEGMAIHSSILAWRIPMDSRAWWVAVHRL